MIIMTSGMTIEGGLTIGDANAPAPPDTDPYYDNVVLLLHGQGTNNGTSIVDSSQYARSPNDIFNIITSNEQAKFGTTSIKSTNYSSLQYASSLDFANTDTWTMEFWMYGNTDQPGFHYFLSSSNIRYFLFDYQVSTDTFAVSSTHWGSIYNVAGVTLIPSNSWNHLAFCQQGTTFYTFLNGQLAEQQQPVYNPISSEAQGLSIVNLFNRLDLPSIPAYLAEVRYTQGVCRYTSSFAVPTAPFPNS